MIRQFREFHWNINDSILVLGIIAFCKTGHMKFNTCISNIVYHLGVWIWNDCVIVAWTNQMPRFSILGWSTIAGEILDAMFLGHNSANVKV